MENGTSRIRWKMASADETSQTLADHLGTNEKSVRTHINNPASMPVGELRAMADRLGMNAADIYTIVMNRQLTVRDIQQMSV